MRRAEQFGQRLGLGGSRVSEILREFLDSVAVDFQSVFVATLTIRNLPDDVRDRLRLRAAQNGRSMEAEVRQVLAEAVEADHATAQGPAERVRRLQAIIEPYRKPGGGVVDEFLAERRRMWGEE